MPFKNLTGPVPQTPIDDGRTALLVLDVHRFTVSREHGFARLARERGIAYELDEYFDQVDQALPNIRRLVEGCRRHRMPIIFTRLAATSSDSVAAQARITGFWTPAESWEAGFPEAVSPAPADLILDKTTAGAFAGKSLERALRDRGIGSLIICGVLANGAVELTARHGADLGFGVIVVPDACAAETWAHHTFVMATLVGGLIRTRSTSDVLGMLAGARA